MKIANLVKEGSLDTMYGDTLVMIGDLMTVAIQNLSGNRECDGLFTLWAKNKKSREPVKQMEFETAKFWRKRNYEDGLYDWPLMMGGGKSIRVGLEEAIRAADKATCEFFPLKSAMRILMPLDQREKRYPLTTGYYVYGHSDDVNCCDPLVMVLRTSHGTFYAGFMANVFDIDSVQKAYNFAIYLFTTLVNVLCALTDENDEMMNYGAAELLDVPERRPELFHPDPKSGLVCFDETHYLFRTLNPVDRVPTQDFLDAVGKRRLRIFERYGMKLKLFAK